MPGELQPHNGTEERLLRSQLRSPWTAFSFPTPGGAARFSLGRASKIIYPCHGISFRKNKCCVDHRQHFLKIWYCHTYTHTHTYTVFVYMFIYSHNKSTSLFVSCIIYSVVHTNKASISCLIG